MNWTTKRVEARFRDAVETLKRLPAESIHGYISAWPPILREAIEVMQMEPVVRLGPPMPEQIDEMHEVVLKWIVWLEEDERKLVWLRAEKVRWKVISWKIGCDRTTAWRKYKLALTKVATILNSRGAK